MAMISGILEPRGPAGALILSDTQVESICPGQKVAPVRVTVNGHAFAGRIMRMRGETLIGFSKAVREACGVAIGEQIDAEVALDEAPREVAVPAELAAALADHPDVREAFDKLAFTHRKEYARWIAEAKREETRSRRVEETVRMVRAGKTRS
jgi:hypothetical protein